ncbi:unnamed protein product [Mytilus coruscus]|uniref:YqaJ viral recombinase domain-containing protein n=1 Tax=Mytilus coruscus TaxID=42192 RepID=A0A6J8CBM7_MYTCO|nr:unnamed protein product [Mytilus coruscus]
MSIAHQLHVYLILTEGASIDSLVTCNKCGVGLVEVKRPYCSDSKKEPWRYKTPIECAKDTNFCSNEVNGQLKLKDTSNYMYQVQGQLGVYELNWVDFSILGPALPNLIILQVAVEETRRKSVQEVQSLESSENEIDGFVLTQPSTSKLTLKGIARAKPRRSQRKKQQASKTTRVREPR